MIKAKVFGAGSIGNHLTQASRRMGWEVTVVDRDVAALKRMKEEIYPKRYGAWDEGIKLFEAKDAPVGGFDVVFIGTPPDSHLPIATKVLREEAPRVLQIEKPLCSPTLEGLDEFVAEVRKHPQTAVIVGFNHILAENTLKAEELIRAGTLGKIQALDSEIRSNWKNILDAHPWLKGPADTYLGFWKKGGGAGGEHIHALNLWQHFAHVTGAGRVAEVSALFDIVSKDGAEYDRLCFLNLVTENGLMGRVVQDVITLPKKKFVELQFEKGHIVCSTDVSKTADQVQLHEHGKDPQIIDIVKNRTDEFFHEVKHIQELLDGKVDIKTSPIRLERGLDSMLVLAAGYKSFNDKRVAKVDYNKYAV